MTQLPTIYAFLLDETGSMEDGLAQTIKAYDAYLDGLLAAEAEGDRFVLTRFNSVKLTTDDWPIASAPRMAQLAPPYKPSHGTPLFDAVGKTIETIRRRLQDRPARVAMVIQTDGQENDSREFKREQVSDLIKQAVTEGWKIIFLGADMDNWAAQVIGASLGLQGDMVAHYNKIDSVQRMTMAARYSASRDGKSLAVHDEQAGDWVTTSTN